MDTLVSGVKGSGKTYYAVYHISKLKDQSKVLHNIKGLELGNNIYDLAKEWGIQPEDFFRDSLHDELSPAHDPRFKELHGYLFVIDECQKLFPKNFKNQDVDQFFQMSRHYDIDSMLLTQDEKLVAPSIKVHPELCLRAVSDTANPLPGFFLYRKLVGWEQVGLPIKIRKKQAVFDLYKSADTKSGGKESRTKARPMVVMISLAIASALGALGYFYYYTGHRSEIRGHSITSTASKEIQKSATSTFNRFSNKNDSENIETDKSLPKSLSDSIGGSMMPISRIQDRNGDFIIIFDQIFSLSTFPYPVLKTPMGEVALVPNDIYEKYVLRKEYIAQQINYDPNSSASSNNNTSKNIN
jgi:zona occludens toxin (predicted ATPase)